MHEGPLTPLFHRDIRWPNIILSAEDASKWFLIDWDDAATSPTRAATHLDRLSHSAAVFRDNHGAEVDIWAVGKLILDARQFVDGIAEPCVTIGKQMVEGQVKTAREAQMLIKAIV